MKKVPAGLEDYELSLDADGSVLSFAFDAFAEETGVSQFIKRLNELGIGFKDLQTQESTLEDIFVTLVESPS